MTPRTMLAPGGQSVRLTLVAALDARHGDARAPYRSAAACAPAATAGRQSPGDKRQQPSVIAELVALGAAYSGRSGNMIVRHMCATGLLS